MTTNPLERAVIEAARLDHSHGCAPEWCGGSRLDPCRLANAIESLERWEKAQDPAVTEVPWSQVVEGDELRSPKNGKFYEVERTIRLSRMSQQDGQFWLVKMTGIEKPIQRPREGEPTAFVKRGATGNAVDTFIDVFSSGGK